MRDESTEVTTQPSKVRGEEREARRGRAPAQVRTSSQAELGPVSLAFQPWAVPLSHSAMQEESLLE